MGYFCKKNVSKKLKKSLNLVTLSTVSVLWNNVSKGSGLAKLAEQWIPEPDRTTAVWPDLAIFERSWQQILLQKLPNYLATVLSIFKDIPLLGNFSKYLVIFYSYIWSRRGSNRQFLFTKNIVNCFKDQNKEKRDRKCSIVKRKCIHRT